MSYTVYEIKDVLGEIARLGTAIESIQLQQSTFRQMVFEKLDRIIQQETQMATNVEILKTKIEEQDADIVAMSAIIDKAVAFADGIAAQYAAALQELKDLIANQGTPEEFAAAVAKMDAANTKRDADRQRLDDALTRNQTPTEPPPPPPSA